MAFALTTFCKSDQNLETCEQTLSVSLDVALVATLVTLVCLLVIGKIDIGLGEVGTIGNRWAQAFIGASLGIFIVDLVALVVKNRCQPSSKSAPPSPIPPPHIPPSHIQGVNVRELLAAAARIRLDPPTKRLSAVAYDVDARSFILYPKEVGQETTFVPFGTSTPEILPQQGMIVRNVRLIANHNPKHIYIEDIRHSYPPLQNDSVKEKLKDLPNQQNIWSINYAPYLGIIVVALRSGEFFYRGPEMSRFEKIPMHGIFLNTGGNLDGVGNIYGEASVQYPLSP